MVRINEDCAHKTGILCEILDKSSTEPFVPACARPPQSKARRRNGVGALARLHNGRSPAATADAVVVRQWWADLMRRDSQLN
jgi:hypothetical protein